MTGRSGALVGVAALAMGVALLVILAFGVTGKTPPPGGLTTVTITQTVGNATVNDAPIT